MAQAKAIRQAAPLRFVGVFVDEALAQVALIAKEVGLAAVQLHGHEDERYLQQLRSLLPQGVEIWKAYRVSDQLPQFSHEADRVLLDA